VIALQEVIADSSNPETNQPAFIASLLSDYEVCFGEARKHLGAP
jgi:hypothetical protein